MAAAASAAAVAAAATATTQAAMAMPKRWAPLAGCADADAAAAAATNRSGGGRDDCGGSVVGGGGGCLTANSSFAMAHAWRMRWGGGRGKWRGKREAREKTNGSWRPTSVGGGRGAGTRKNPKKRGGTGREVGWCGV